SLTLSSKATADADVTLLNGATCTVDGHLINNYIVTMYNGTTANINGNVDGVTFQAKTGEYPTYDEEDDGARNNIDTDDTLGVTSKITLTNMKGIVISITSKTYTKDEVSKTNQMMNVVGTPDFVDKETESAIISITEDVYVPAGGELVLSKDMTMSGTGTIITEGMLAITNGTVDNYKGAHYQMKVPGETSGYIYIDYYTNFDDAYAKIASSEGKTVTINGGYEFAKSYTIAADQIVDFDTATISEEGVVTVEEDGELSDGFTEIKGTLIVKDGATCTPNADSYEVSSKDADGTWTYTSAELAIANAKAGDTVYITNSVTFDKDATVPEGVTVDVASDASISAGEDLIINGKIINNGTIAVTGNLLVNGEVVNENSFTVTGVSSEATVKGTYSGELSVTSNKINAAKYSDDVDVYTSVASAIAATSKMDVPKNITVTGEVSESSEIVLAAVQKLTIDGTVVLKSVRVIVDSQLIITSTGKLSADVIAATGTETTTGALSDSVITLKEAQDVTFSVKKNESTSTTTLYMGKTTSGLTGTFNVATGSVELKDAITVGNTLTVKVASGAELVIKNAISGAAEYFSNEGTLTVAATTSISSMNLGGTVDVRKDVNLTVTDITVTGKIDTAENAKVSIADGEYMYIGSTPETLGASTSVSAAVAFGDNAYVVVFNGSSFTNTNDVKMDSTSYSINDVAFAKVYIAENGVVSIKVLNAIVNGLKDLKVTYNGNATLGNETYKWKSGSFTVENVGDYDAVNTTIGYAKADFTISAGPGLIVYIDDILVDTTIQNSYEIGTHTITIYIDKGYEGTPVIKVNGNTVTDGKLVVTTEMLKNNPNMIVVTGATPSVTPPPTPHHPNPPPHHPPPPNTHPP
ncbi:MAG: hypothetical protein IJX35_05505, partial [Candidatus Methanomethylophilaceae archaeon]|nr:hypothetical protein [Candidatus Methanomethylophilaceae archaeon]